MGRTCHHLLGWSAITLVMGAASGDNKGYNCCAQPPPPRLTLPMPPKPPWVQTSLECLEFEVHGPEEQNLRNTSTLASVSGRNIVSAGSIAAIIVALLLLLAIIILLAIFVWYKKHYLKYQISPSAGMRNSRSRGGNRPVSQQALVTSQSLNVDNTSQVSISSDGDQTAEPEKAEIMPLEVARGSLTPGVGLHHPDLRQEDADAVMRSDNSPRYGCLAAQPDVVESTLQPGGGGLRLSPLPVLRPIQSIYNPTFTRQLPPDGFSPLPSTLDGFPSALNARKSPRLPPLRRSWKKKN